MNAIAIRSQRRTLGALLAALSLAVLVGCPGFGEEGVETDFPDLPEEPTFQDVAPFFDTYCNECHADPAEQGAPSTFRYDVCEETDGKPGAQQFAARAKSRTVEKLPTPMPPENYSPQPNAEDVELLRRWVDTGAPCDSGMQ